MGLISAMFGKSKPAAKEPVVVTLQLNAKLMPFDRGEYFEAPLIEFVAQRGLGELDGGGDPAGRRRRDRVLRCFDSADGRR